MAKKEIKRVTRALTDDEKPRHARIRDQVMKGFPPAQEKKQQPVHTRIAAELRKARKAQGLTYDAAAKQAGIPNSNTVKDIEYGRDEKLSNIEAFAGVHGMKLELVDV